MTKYTGVERRSQQDRRQNRLRLSKRLFFNGRRESGRRAEDRRQIMALDRYSPSLFIGIVLVLCLSLLDALLTLILLSQGARELNPVMAYYLSHGPHVFLSVKYGLTALSVLLVVLLNDSLYSRYCLSSRTLLHLFAAGFGSVVIWQCYLLML